MIVTNVPPFLPEVVVHWQDKLKELRAANTAARSHVDYMDNEYKESHVSAEQLRQARLQQLSAAQTYNSFVESGSQYIKMAQDAESRLQRRDLSLLEIIQLKTTRDTM
jgi:hypothetical protein